MPGSLPWRARNVMLGAVLGAALGFPFGNTFNSVIFPKCTFIDRMPLTWVDAFCGRVGAFEAGRESK